MTPEGKIKKRINELLDTYGEDLYKYMPVPVGYGIPTVDYLICFKGCFIAIEAKRPKGKPTARQEGTLESIMAAGGATFVVNDDQSLETLRMVLDSIAKYGYRGYP